MNIARSISAVVLALSIVQHASAQDTLVQSAATATKQSSDIKKRLAELSPKEMNALASAVEELAKAASQAAGRVEALEQLVASNDSTAAAIKSVTGEAQGKLQEANKLTAAVQESASVATSALAAPEQRGKAALALASVMGMIREASDAAKAFKSVVDQVPGDNDALARALTEKALPHADKAVRALLGIVSSGSEISAQKTDAPVFGPKDEPLLAALRAQITGGAIFFNGAARIVRNATGTEGVVQSTQFSQAATYLAFEVQPRFVSASGGRCSDDPASHRKRCDKRRAEIESRGYNRFYFDPTAAVRLTAFPVTGTNGQALTRVEAPSNAFVQSQKAAQVQVGVLGSVNFGGFVIKESPFHWAVGPSAKFGFQSVTDSQRALRVWDLDNDLFKMPSAGVRLTLYEKDREVGGNVRKGWAPAAYLDATWGHFENFETAVGGTESALSCLQDPPACLARTEGVPQRREFFVPKLTRTYLEGRIFLQYIYLGFDLNTGDGTDDLRFIAGVTMKLDQFFVRR